MDDPITAALSAALGFQKNPALPGCFENGRRGGVQLPVKQWQRSAHALLLCFSNLHLIERGNSALSC
jgi:hypothetical protein